MENALFAFHMSIAIMNALAVRKLVAQRDAWSSDAPHLT
jgi:hypothetical protein